MELISKEEAKKAIREAFQDLPSRIEINMVINSIPTTELVTCGECKWWKPLKYWDGRIAHNCIWMACNLPKNEYEFCSEGERSTDETD